MGEREDICSEVVVIAVLEYGMILPTAVIPSNYKLLPLQGINKCGLCLKFYTVLTFSLQLTPEFSPTCS